MKVEVGDTVLVFDPKLWGGKDKGNNSQFWKRAEILSLRWYKGNKVATVRFEHDGRESRDHFVRAMKPC